MTKREKERAKNEAKTPRNRAEDVKRVKRGTNDQRLLECNWNAQHITLHTHSLSLSLSHSHSHTRAHTHTEKHTITRPIQTRCIPLKMATAGKYTWTVSLVKFNFSSLLRFHLASCILCAIWVQNTHWGHPNSSSAIAAQKREYGRVFASIFVAGALRNERHTAKFSFYLFFLRFAGEKYSNQM